MRRTRPEGPQDSSPSDRVGCPNLHLQLNMPEEALEHGNGRVNYLDESDLCGSRQPTFTLGCGVGDPASLAPCTHSEDAPVPGP